jgi:hypothetical protein
MKILETFNFIKLSINLQTHPTFKIPVDIDGPIDIFNDKSDSKDDITKKWKRKTKQRSGIKLPYQK